MMAKNSHTKTEFGKCTRNCGSLQDCTRTYRFLQEYSCSCFCIEKCWKACFSSRSDRLSVNTRNKHVPECIAGKQNVLIYKLLVHVSFGLCLSASAIFFSVIKMSRPPCPSPFTFLNDANRSKRRTYWEGILAPYSLCDIKSDPDIEKEKYDTNVLLSTYLEQNEKGII